MGTTKAFIKNPETLFALETMRDRYWHNMAARIQRMWRNYLRYRNECATRIQRFWRSKKDGIEFQRFRQKGHDLLAGRKERRRYSLVSMRRFAGDYLDVGGKSSSGGVLKTAAGLSPSETVVFSGRVELLKSAFGRSSKPSPRFLVVTNSAAYFLISSAKDGRISTTIDRKVPLVTIRSVGLSNLRDDWIAFNTTASEEGDPIFTSVFKTELVTQLHKATSGSLQINIGSSIDYAKKKDKRAQITFRKDETVLRNDVYKSHVVSVGSGESPTSQSKPAARRLPGVVRPITQGKLIRRGGPSTPHPSVSAPRSHALALPTRLRSLTIVPITSLSSRPRALPPSRRPSLSLCLARWPPPSRCRTRRRLPLRGLLLPRPARRLFRRLGPLPLRRLLRPSRTCRGTSRCSTLRVRTAR